MKYGIGRVEGQSDSPSLIIISLTTIPRKKYFTVFHRTKLKTLAKQSKQRNEGKFNRTVASTMSLGAVREEFWQSTARGTISERCKSIFNQKVLSDVKFVVRGSQGGSESNKIPADKFLLAMSSPVFFAMFYMTS